MAGANPLTPLVINLPPLSVNAEIVRIPLPVDVEVSQLANAIGASLRALTSGTVTVTLKNNAGGLIATIVWTAVGLATVTRGPVTTLAAGDVIHVGATGIGSGALDCCLTLWLKVPATAT